MGIGVYTTDLPVTEKVGFLDHAFSGAVTRLEGLGIADDLIAKVYERGADLSKTLKAISSETGFETGSIREIWMEEGHLGSAQGATGWVRDYGGKGWVHIRNNHVINPRTDFVRVFGSNYQNEAQVQQLIFDGAKYGTEGKDSLGRYRRYVVPETDGKILRVGIGENGEVISAYPWENQ